MAAWKNRLEYHSSSAQLGDDHNSGSGASKGSMYSHASGHPHRLFHCRIRPEAWKPEPKRETKVGSYSEMTNLVCSRALEQGGKKKKKEQGKQLIDWEQRTTPQNNDIEWSMVSGQFIPFSHVTTESAECRSTIASGCWLNNGRISTKGHSVCILSRVGALARELVLWFVRNWHDESWS
ncbi:uncharacterized protein P174DRAFT_261464 [Aspergillus novofumigatus IBT 16806]|uniref:Uncharacterized protein n=1 Tax=Aspergillus novofumigatus (strain IBT 16806) TaxID=1392255 RepID=A0A2I1C3E5_ASPN1|nr:uncharacterized protein P174DRAFT_261464 [Aspergillus novofumigatus IBT 16806]PKX92146.1 hypothetical protein P174DRAFT_261464 [Aspergillus novofumigatus IBT 16806]